MALNSPAAFAFGFATAGLMAATVMYLAHCWDGDGLVVRDAKANGTRGDTETHEKPEAGSALSV
jgi:hypothetical protein